MFCYELTLYAGFLDEPWPNDLSDEPWIKPSTIASKSVTSLGKITENEEKETWSPDETYMTNTSKSDKVLQVNVVMKKIEELLADEKQSTSSPTNETLTKISTESSTTQASLITKIKEKDIAKAKIVSKNTQFKEHQTDGEESEFEERTDDDEMPTQIRPILSVDYGWSEYLIFPPVAKKRLPTGP